MQNHRLVPFLQISGGLALGLGVVLVVLRILVGRQADESGLVTLGAAALLLLLGLGLGMTLLGVAALLAHRPEAYRPAAADGELGQVRELLLELRDEFDLLRSNIATDIARREVAEEAQALESDVPTNPFSIAPPPPPSAEPAAMMKVMHLLEEVREIALMSEPQRQELLKKRKHARKVDRLKRAQAEIANGHWAEAQRLIDLVAAEHSGDADLVQVQDELRIARGNAQQEAVERARSRIEDLMALTSWDEARDIAAQLAADYPDSPDARALHERVTRERNLFRDNTAERLYKDVKDHIEHRSWRRARAEAERLLEKFGDHRRAARIREQIDVIRENADVEERQEQEQRIQELIKARRLAEAIEMAEGLIERFPTSPQAAGLQELLPRLRERAIREEIGT